jgi:outer membrane murein-binding lipoprotein Lpp
MVHQIKHHLSIGAAVLGAVLLLTGCAPSESTATKVATADLATRVDQFQGAASNSKVAVIVGKSTVGVIPLDGSSPMRVALDGMVSLIDAATCGDNSFVALDFYKKVWTSTDDGKNWSSKPTPAKWVPLALTCGPGNSYWVVGSDSTVASSADRGASWTVHHSGEDALYNSVQFTGEQSLVVTGEFGAVLRSADRGKTWAKSVIDDEFYPYAALFVSPQVGYVSSLTGTIMRTRNGGASWEKMKNDTGLSQFTLVKVGAQVYSVGLGGSVLQLSGDRWLPVKVEGLQSAPYLRGATAIGNDQFLAVGGNGAWKIISAK